MVLVGGINQYNIWQDWQVHKEQLEIFCRLNDTEPADWAAVLLSSLRDDEYRKVYDLCTPDLPRKKSYVELTKLCDTIFNAPKSVFRERMRFYGVHKEPTQTVHGWAIQLQRLCRDCQFGNRLEKVLVDRFISGLRYSPQLLSEFLTKEFDREHLTLQEAVKIAVRKENSINRSAS